jgi:hypothetical protein
MAARALRLGSEFLALRTPACESQTDGPGVHALDHQTISPSLLLQSRRRRCFGAGHQLFEVNNVNVI